MPSASMEPGSAVVHARAAASSPAEHRAQACRHVADGDRAGVERVADLAVERVVHRSSECAGVGMSARHDDPRPARAVQAHGRAGLLGKARAPRRPAPIHVRLRARDGCRRTARVLRPDHAVDEHRHALGQACFGAGGSSACSTMARAVPQGIGADPEHDRVAGTVPQASQQVRAPLEHEAHRAETGTHHIDPPAGMVDRLDDLPSSRRRVRARCAARRSCRSASRRSARGG